MDFSLEHTDLHSKARAGIMRTEHGSILTPIFMPVGTLGSVKSINTRQLTEDVHAQIILGNTYHLYLRPGLQIMEKAGGLHRFMNWEKPILTDSGGFQVFSLAKIRKIKEEGVYFQSHIDGSRHFFTPENVVDTQRVIGSDIMMALDECTPGDASYQYAKKSLDLTLNWLKRGYNHYKETTEHYGYHQSFFPIVQGCIYPDLRRKSAEIIAEMEVEGNAIGGLAVGEPAEKMYEMIEVVNEILPLHRPRYLMGVGTPINILEAIERGVDMFDCVMPTRNGRNAMLFTKKGVLNMKNAKWKEDFSPIEEDGECWMDRSYSKSYLRHLFISNELLALQIASVHNLSFYLWLVGEARRHILEDTFLSWKKEMVAQLSVRL